MKNPESNEPVLTSQQVIAALRAAYARGEKSSDSAVPLLNQWLNSEKSRLPATSEGEIELQRQHAHVLAAAGFPATAIDLLGKTWVKHEAELQKNPHLAHLIRIDVDDIQAMREINEDMRAIEGNWKQIFLDPEK